MKVVPPAESKKKQTGDLILPLELAAEKKLAKDKYACFKVRTVPTQADSTTYELYIPYCDETATVREAIKAYSNIDKVILGNNLQTFEQKRAICETVYKGECLTRFQSRINEFHALVYSNAVDAAVLAEIERRRTAVPPEAPMTQQELTNFCNNVAEPAMGNDDLIAGMQAATETVCPHGALEKVKRYLRRNCRKPAHMNVRQYAVRLKYINEEEIPKLPPGYNVAQSMSDNELKEILTWGLPKSWNNKAIERGFDPLHPNHRWERVVRFFEQIEAAEEFNPKQQQGQDDHKPSPKKAKKSSGKTSSSNKPKCPIHGYGHSADDCRTLKAMIAQGSGSGGSNHQSKNKSWSRKAQDAKDKTKKDLAAFIQKTVRKELNSINKRSEPSSDEDSDDNQSVNQIEKDLANFNFADLKVSSDSDDDRSEGEISV